MTRDIVFKGQRYSVGVLVNSALEWKAYRFGYEYDFIVTNRGYGGFILEAKYTDVKATLDALDSTGSPLFTEFAHARAPIPALGGVVRVYPIPNISVTAEVTGIKLPNTISEDYEGHYADIDIYGILQLHPNVGTQIAGGRSTSGISSTKTPARSLCGGRTSDSWRGTSARQPAPASSAGGRLRGGSRPACRNRTAAWCARRPAPDRSCCLAPQPRPRPSRESVRTPHRRRSRTRQYRS